MEDLFYNVPSRQKAFRSPSEEYVKILDIVGRYAVHCAGLAFTCKKHGDSLLGISTTSNATTVDSIRQIHGSSLASELVEFSISNDRWGFEASGWTSNANYHVKKTALLLFINHRSVESSTIKKSIEQTYANFLPKGGHPFTYLRLDIAPERVDVNVHPTKREVNFLNEDEIVEEICSVIRTRLSQVDTSRTFLTQSILPGTTITSLTTPFSKPSFTRKPSTNLPHTPVKPLENNLVRTDPSLRKITSMLSPTAGHLPSNKISHFQKPVYTISPRATTTCRLTTVKELRAAVRDNMHTNLTEAIATHIYVGLVDSMQRIAAIQSGVKLFLIDYGLLSNEYFYQLGLTDFGNFGAIKFEPELDVEELVRLGVEAEKRAAESTVETSNDSGSLENRAGTDPINWAVIPQQITGQLVSCREMLLEYFSLEISPTGQLLSIPLLLKDYTPPLVKLPRFLARLGPCIDWTDEKRCFDGFLRELARFYVVERLPCVQAGEGEGEGEEVGGQCNGQPKQISPEEEEKQQQLKQAEKQQHDGNSNNARTQRVQEVERMLEHVLFPAFRKRLVATKGLLAGVVEVADLKGLYRVFERC